MDRLCRVERVGRSYSSRFVGKCRVSSDGSTEGKKEDVMKKKEKGEENANGW